MKKTAAVFVIGTIISLITVGGGLMAYQKYAASADPSIEPKDIKITRVSPTAGEITFETDKETIASIQCSDKKEGPFTLCGSETQRVTSHRIKTAIILDPEKKYFFQLFISGRKFDDLGLPFILDTKTGDQPINFPTELLGKCDGNNGFDTQYDVNKDGCIRQNDRDLMGR